MNEANLNNKIVVVIDDLFFSSKIREAAKPLGLDIGFIKTTDGLIEKLEFQKPSLLIFDLNCKASNPLQIIKNLKSSPALKDIPVLGYISHVQTELKEEAAKAGCDLVLPRSKFSKDLREILMKYSTLGIIEVSQGGISMDEIDPSNLPLVINIESKDYAPGDSEWQGECRQLYTQIKNALDTGTVEPLRVEEEEKGHRGGFLEMFSTITAGVASIGGFTAIVELAKLFLEHRKGCEITLKFPDGSEMKVSGASKEDIMNVYEKQLAKQGK